MLQKKVAIHYATVDEKPIHSTCHLTGYRERLLQKMTGKWLQFSMRWLMVITLIFGHVSKNFPCNISFHSEKQIDSYSTSSLYRQQTQRPTPLGIMFDKVPLKSVSTILSWCTRGFSVYRSVFFLDGTILRNPTYKTQNDIYRSNNFQIFFKNIKVIRHLLHLQTIFSWSITLIMKKTYRFTCYIWNLFF